MKCSKGRFAFYPILETLEDRLQPGSVILGEEFGWSLLADQLANSKQDSAAADKRVFEPALENSKSSPTSTPGEADSPRLADGPAPVLAELHAQPLRTTTLNGTTIETAANYQTTHDLHATALALSNSAPQAGGAAANQGTVNFLSYLGKAGPDSINGVAVRTEDGGNFI